MAGANDKSKRGYRILLGAFVVVSGGSMLLYLVPQSPTTGEVSTDTVARVGDESVSLQDVRQQLAEIEQRNQVPKPLEALYAQQILKQLVFQKEIEYEAKRLGITVSDQERADRIRQFLPTAFNGSTFVGMDRYALVDVNQIRQNLPITDDQLKLQYQANIQQYQVPNRVHVEHILFMTVRKTDAEVEEVRKKAEDVLRQARKGAKFEDLAKKYSEDPGTKDKGGDLGWIVQKQTVPEFEKTAFNLSPGQISDLVHTQYGFHIIKVLEKETAHTKSFEEVRESLRTPLLLSLADKQASTTADQLSAAIRQSNKISLDDLAKQHHLTVGETRAISATDPLLELGNSQETKDAIFRLRTGELSLPVRTDRGYVVLSLKDVQPAHQGSLEEVRDRVLNDLKREKSIELARSRAEELAKRAKSGEKFDAAAKALGLEAKTSEFFARNGSIPGAASGKQLSAAFNLKPGDVAAPLSLGQNWLVYRVTEKEEPNQANFETQKKQLTEEVLQSKRSLAFEAFRTALENRLKQEGKLKLMPEKLKTFGSLG